MRSNPFKIWMWQKVHRWKQGCIIVISGKMGKGKTTFACSLAEEFDINQSGKSRFDSSEIVADSDKDGKIFHRRELVPRLVHSLEDFKRLRSRKWPYGTAFIIDEGQATINRRDWNSRKNKFFNILVSTGRVFNSYIFITMPFWKVLDSETKLYVDAMIDVKGFDPVTGKTTYTPYFLHPGYDEPIYFRVRQKNGRLKKVRGCTQYPPSSTLFWSQKRKVDAWKMAIPQDLVSRDGSYRSVDDEVVPKSRAQVAKDYALNKSEKWFGKLLDRRKDFLWGSHYSTTRLRRETLESVSVVNHLIKRFEEYDKENPS